MQLDLVLRGGRVIDPSQGVDSVMDVGFQNGRVAGIGAELNGAEVKDVGGLIVVLGLVDLHTHVYRGVDPRTQEWQVRLCRRGGRATDRGLALGAPRNCAE